MADCICGHPESKHNYTMTRCKLCDCTNFEEQKEVKPMADETDIACKARYLNKVAKVKPMAENEFTENEVKEALNTAVEQGLLKVVWDNGETKYVETEYAHFILAEREATAQELFDEFICPMCYRLNPQHATMDDGEGCHSCEDKSRYLVKKVK